MGGRVGFARSITDSADPPSRQGDRSGSGGVLLQCLGVLGSCSRETLLTVLYRAPTYPLCQAGHLLSLQHQDSLEAAGAPNLLRLALFFSFFFLFSSSLCCIFAECEGFLPPALPRCP